MTRAKVDKSVWQIFFEALKIFCMNIHKFFFYMSFPILGQVLGIFLIFGLTYWFNNNINLILEKYPVMNNLSTVTTAIILLALPGLLIFLRAFWDYLIAYGALNSMTEGAISSGRIYDFPAHNAVVKNRAFSYILLWILFGIFTTFASFPLFWVLGGIFFIYFILIFQVFTFSQDISAISCFRESMSLIKGKFARTALLLVLLCVILYFVYHGLTVLFEVAGVNAFLTKIFANWVMTLPLDQINSVYQKFDMLITPDMVAGTILSYLTAFLAMGFTLPIRSIAWTLWYKNLYKFEQEPTQKPAKKSRKSAQKKLDKNILKRAMQEDEEF